jgi:hypothetical protein
MTRTRRAALPPLLCLLLPLGLTACGGEDSPVDGVEVERTVEGGDAGTDEVGTDLVSFELPDGWTVLDEEAMTERAGSDANPLLEDMSDRLGLTPEQLAAQMDAVELYAAAPGGAVQGFLTNVNVIEQPTPPGGLPDAEAIRPELMLFADEVGDIEPIETDSGLEGLRADYRVSSGELDILGEQLYAEIDDQLVIISISAARAEDAAEIADLVERTLAAS